MSPHGVFGAWGELRKHGFLIGVIAVCNGIVPALVSCLHWYRACTGIAPALAPFLEYQSCVTM